jgi:hypothetical protein
MYFQAQIIMQFIHNKTHYDHKYSRSCKYLAVEYTYWIYSYSLTLQFHRTWDVSNFLSLLYASMEWILKRSVHIFSMVILSAGTTY